MSMWQHAFDRFLRHKEAAEGADDQRLPDLNGIEFGDWAARAVARVVDDHVRGAEFSLDVGIELGYIATLGRIAGEGPAAHLSGERPKFGHAPRREGDTHTGLSEEPRQR